MPDSFSKNIIYLSEAQRQELFANDTITVNGVTVTYNENDIYVTPQSEPIVDVKINNVSIGSNGIANIPLTGQGILGAVQLNSLYGISHFGNGFIGINKADATMCKAGIENNRPIVPSNQEKSVFYGLTKAAGVDLKDVSNITVGTYPDTSKAAIQNMLGITSLFAAEESSTATAAHAANSLFMMNGKLMRATTAIAAADAVEVGTNCEIVKADEVFVKNTDYTSKSNFGIVRIGNGITVSNGVIAMATVASDTVKNGTSSVHAVTPNKQHEAVYFGLSKLAGIDLKEETVTVGTYPETSKTAIRSLIGAAAASDIPSVPVQDVQVAGTSALSNGIANIPIANSSTPGVIKIGDGLRINTSNQITINSAGSTLVKQGTASSAPLTPEHAYEAAFYGLAKAAGADEKDSTLSVGTYTETAKSAIRGMLGAASLDVIAVQDEQPTNADTKVWLPETEPIGIEVPTYAEFTAGLAGKVSDVQLNNTSIVSNNIANIPLASGSTLGVVKTGGMGIAVNSNNGEIYVVKATDAHIKSASANFQPIVPSNQHQAVFYGLAKAAGYDEKNSEELVGTYSTEAKAAIQTMLGVPGDVQVNGTSVVSNGVANIPICSSSTFGVVKIDANSFGIKINNEGKLYTDTPSLVEIKAGTQAYKPIVSANVHYAAFYGLAKAAGDTTQSASSNTVGTYTSEAKAAIQSMLGIDLSSIAQQVEIPLVESVSGTTPTITGQPNTRYVCGEVSTISITPPSAGSVDVIFESGSTAAVLTVPNTVKWPAWFDATTLETDTTYEILITDGVYGSVMTWAN